MMPIDFVPVYTVYKRGIKPSTILLHNSPKGCVTRKSSRVMPKRMDGWVGKKKKSDG